MQRVSIARVAILALSLIALHTTDTHAQTTSSNGPGSFGTFEVGLPGDGKFQKNASIDTFISSFQDTAILSLVGLFVKFIIGIIVIIGVITMVVGGYLYMTAAGNAHQVEQAKEMIYSSLVGIFIAFISVVILNTINPFLGSNAVEPKLASPSASNAAIIKDPGSSDGSSNGSTTNTTNNTGNNGGNNQPDPNKQQLDQYQAQQKQYQDTITKLDNIKQQRPLTAQEQSEYDNAVYEYNYYTDQITALQNALGQ